MCWVINKLCMRIIGTMPFNNNWSSLIPFFVKYLHWNNNITLQLYMISLNSPLFSVTVTIGIIKFTNYHFKFHSCEKYS